MYTRILLVCPLFGGLSSFGVSFIGGFTVLCTSIVQGSPVATAQSSPPCCLVVAPFGQPPLLLPPPVPHGALRGHAAALLSTQTSLCPLPASAVCHAPTPPLPDARVLPPPQPVPHLPCQDPQEDELPHGGRLHAPDGRRHRWGRRVACRLRRLLWCRQWKGVRGQQNWKQTQIHHLNHYHRSGHSGHNCTDNFNFTPLINEACYLFVLEFKKNCIFIFTMNQS